MNLLKVNTTSSAVIGLAVLEPRLRIEVEDDPGVVVGVLDLLRDQAVVDLLLVLRRRHQACRRTSRCRRRHSSPLGVAVEVVKAADGAHAQRAALGRVRVHVVEVRESRRVLGLAVKRDRVRNDDLRGGAQHGGAQQPGSQRRQERGERERFMGQR